MSFDPRIDTDEENQKINLLITNGNQSRNMIVEYSGEINVDKMNMLSKKLNMPDYVYDYVTDRILCNDLEDIEEKVIVPKNENMEKLVTEIKTLIEESFPGSRILDVKKIEDKKINSFDRDM